MGEPERLAEVQAKLAEERAHVLALLDGEALQADLSAGARRLGSILVETADDTGLWNRLAGKSNEALTEKQRLHLRAAVEIDWVDVLNGIGYQPPPPAELYAGPFAEAIGRAFDKRDADIDSIRARVRELGNTLIALGGEPDAPPSRLRRLLRRGARVAGKLVIVAGVAAAGVALSHILLPSAAALAAAAHIAPQSLIAEFLVEVVKGAVLPEVESTLDDELPASAAKEAERLAENDALAGLYGIADARLMALRSNWTGLLAGDSKPESVASDSKALLEQLKRSLYVAWDAAIGTSWFTRELSRRFDALARELLDVERLLNEPTPSASAIAGALEKLADAFLRVKMQIPDERKPLDPLAELGAQLELQWERTTELQAQVTRAEHERTLLRQELLRLRHRPARLVGAPPRRKQPAPGEIEKRKAELYAQLEPLEKGLTDLCALREQAEKTLQTQRARYEKLSSPA